MTRQASWQSSAISAQSGSRSSRTPLRQVVDAGAELILFTALSDQAEQAERLASEVVPAFG